MKIDLPWPPAELNPNRKNGKHWSSTHALKTSYMNVCYWSAWTAVHAAGYVPPEGSIGIVITFVQPNKRKRDHDNLLASLKSGLDGLAKALGVDDQHFDPITLKRAYGTKPGKVTVEVMA